MLNDDFNKGENFRSIDGQGFVRSVSVIFQVQDSGYLLCSEMRKGFPNPDIRTHEDHMVGGKVEMDDISTLYCGFREFCEETGYRCPDENSDDLDIEESIKVMTSKFKKCPTVKWDFCVSPKKGMYNRFYIIRIDDCDDFEFFTHFMDFVNGWEKKEDIPIESLFFWKEGEPFQHKMTSLLQTFVANLPSESDFH